MSNLSPSQARDNGANGSGGGLHLPSFKDLVSFSKGDTHADSMAMPTSRRREVVDESPPSFRAVDRSQDHVKVKHASASHQIEPQSQQRHVENRPQTGEMTQERRERALHDPRNSTHQFSNGVARTNQSPRDEVLRHHDSIVAQALKRPHDRMDYESSHSRQAQMHKSSHQDTYMHVSRPSSHPMKRSTDEYPQIAPSPSSRLPPRSEEPSASNPSLHRRYNDERRPLPTQPIPSQGSRVASQSPQQYQSEARHRPQEGEQHIARQRQIAPSPSQTLPLDRSRNYTHHSSRPQAGSFDQPQRGSPPLPAQSYQINRSAIMSNSQAQSASPRLPMPSSQGRMFDYSCARLPDERGLPSPSMSMRPPPLNNYAVHRRPGSSHLTDAVRGSEIRRQRVPSNPEHASADQRRYAPHQQLVREEVGGRHRADEPLPSPRYSHERPQPGGNGHALHRASSSVDLRGSGGSKFLREERSPQITSSHRSDTSLPSPGMQMRAVAKPAPGAPGEVEFVGHRLASNGGTRSDPTYSDIERSSRPSPNPRPDSTSFRPQPPHATTPQQHIWEQEQRQRRQLEEERLRYMQQQRQPDPAPHPRQNGYDRRNEARDEQARREHQHMQARQLRPQSMTPPSHTVRLEDGSHQMRAPASSPGWRERPLEEAVYYVDRGSGRAVRPELPSPRSLHPNSASVEPSYRRRERSAEGSIFQYSPAQKRVPEEGQRVSNGSSRHFPDAERSTTSYRDGQLQQFIVNGVRAPPQERSSTAAAVYHTDAPVRYAERSQPSEVHRVYREAPHSRPQEGADLQPSSHPPSEYTRTQAAAAAPSQHELRPTVSPNLSTADKARSHPPHPSTVVIASQHTTIANSRTTMSPPTRPLKRLRAGSDTSLVLKTSRFTVDEGDRQTPVPPASRIPPQPQPQPHAAVEPERLHGEARLYHSNPNEKISSSGSAPITPPPSN